MQDALRAGIALFNDGWYHAAHDAWEERWLELSEGTPDERLLHGLIQYTAAVHHLATGNVRGAEGLAGSAGEYLAEVAPEHRDVAVDPLRSTLSRLVHDPTAVTPGDAAPITIDGTAIALEDLAPEAQRIAARVIADALDWCDEAVVRDAIAFGNDDRDTRWHALVAEFVEEPDGRAIVYRRLAAMVERERGRRDGVDRLFDEE